MRFMSGLEGHFLIGFALLLLAITGSRFVVQELIALVKLCKELKGELRELPAHQPPALSDTGSTNVSRLADRSSAE
jgi:hypothetical protein